MQRESVVCPMRETFSCGYRWERSEISVNMDGYPPQPHRSHGNTTQGAPFLRLELLMDGIGIVSNPAKTVALTAKVYVKMVMLYDHQRMGRTFDSGRLHNLLFSSVRAGDIMNGYDSVPFLRSNDDDDDDEDEDDDDDVLTLAHFPQIYPVITIQPKTVPTAESKYKITRASQHQHARELELETVARGAPRRSL